jgi:hypothetical protein
VRVCAQSQVSDGSGVGDALGHLEPQQRFRERRALPCAPTRTRRPLDGPDLALRAVAESPRRPAHHRARIEAEGGLDRLPRHQFTKDADVSGLASLGLEAGVGTEPSNEIE